MTPFLTLAKIVVCKLGSFADRERRKWTEKAIAMQNNPYSKESIERRLSQISTGKSHGYGLGTSR